MLPAVAQRCRGVLDAREARSWGPWQPPRPFGILKIFFPNDAGACTCPAEAPGQRRCWSGNQAELAGAGGGLAAAGRAELAQDVADVLLDGVEDDHELACDGPVRPA